MQNCRGYVHKKCKLVFFLRQSINVNKPTIMAMWGSKSSALHFNLHINIVYYLMTSNFYFNIEK